MHISDEALQEFIEIAKEDYGIILSEGEATVIAKRLLMLFELIHRPLPDEVESKQPSVAAASAGLVPPISGSDPWQFTSKGREDA